MSSTVGGIPIEEWKEKYLKKSPEEIAAEKLQEEELSRKALKNISTLIKRIRLEYNKEPLSEDILSELSFGWYEHLSEDKVDFGRLTEIYKYACKHLYEDVKYNFTHVHMLKAWRGLSHQEG